MTRAHIDAPGRTVAHPGVSVQNLEAAGIEPAPKIGVSRDQPGKWLSGEDSQKATVTATALPGEKLVCTDPSWPPVGSKVTVRTMLGLTKARVVSYGKGLVRVVFDAPELNTEPKDACGGPHRTFVISAFLRTVEHEAP